MQDSVMSSFSGALRAAVAPLVEEYLTTLDHRARAIVEVLKQEIAEYSAIPSEDVEGSTEAIIRTVLQGLLGQGVDVTGIAALDELARRRVAQGFPLEALTRSIQLAAREVLREIMVLGERTQVPAQALLSAQDLAWQFANAAASVIGSISREMAEDLARRDMGRRSDFLRGVLHGALDARRIQAEASLYGLDPAVRYHPLRARPADEREEDKIALAIRQTGSTQHHRAVIGALEGDLIALAPQPPIVGDELLLAIGEARDLAAIRESFLSTALALDTAQTFRHRGLVLLSDLAPLPLALSGGLLAQTLERRYFEPLEREGESGKDVEETARIWLSLDQRSDEVAASMHVHRNTVRYRLGRFRELTGLDLRRTDDLVTAWWLLNRRAAERHRTLSRRRPPG